MDVCRKLDGVRWSLNQDDSNQVIIKKEKEIVYIQNFDHKLDTKEAFNLLNRKPEMKHTELENKSNSEMVEEKLNMEIKTEKIIPIPNVCRFCNCRPRPITIASTNEDGGVIRALECKCISSVKKDQVTGEVLKAKFKRWIYTVDIVNNNTDDADIRLINEWNRRMP